MEKKILLVFAIARMNSTIMITASEMLAVDEMKMKTLFIIDMSTQGLKYK